MIRPMNFLTLRLTLVGAEPGRGARYLFMQQSLVMAVIVFLAMYFAFQPAYFGDELFPLYVAKTSSSWTETFLRINEYKPRLIYNGIWAELAWTKAPRSFTAALTAFFMWWSAMATVAIAVRILRARMALAFVAGLCVAISRFGIVFYYDQLSGLIGALGLAAFLTSVLVMWPLLEARSVNYRREAAWLGLAVVTIFVYETYIAALFVVGISVACFGFLDPGRSSRDRVRIVVLGMASWLVPLVLFLLATRHLATLPANTGTAGQAVVLGVPTIRAFSSFAMNVFLGTNIGQPWFTGQFNARELPGLVAGIVFSCLLGSLWIATLVLARTRFSRRGLSVSLVIVLVALGTIAISSLPGDLNADARWMFPLSAFVALLILSIPASIPRALLLVALLVVSVFHVLMQTSTGIYNVVASRISGQVARALSSATPLGERGVVLGLDKNQLNWILGGDQLQTNDVTSGAVYCWINLPGLPCVDPSSALDRRAIADYDFALVYPEGMLTTPHLYMVSAKAAAALASPTVDSLSSAQILGGGDVGWKDWAWRNASPRPGADTKFSTHTFATSIVSAEMLAGKIVAYEAYADAAGKGSLMRLQVNWLNKRSGLISTQIKVVTLSDSPQVFTMLLERPGGASSAEVYVALHQPAAAGDAFIRSVSLLKP